MRSSAQATDSGSQLTVAVEEGEPNGGAVPSVTVTEPERVRDQASPSAPVSLIHSVDDPSSQYWIKIVEEGLEEGPYCAVPFVAPGQACNDDGEEEQ